MSHCVSELKSVSPATSSTGFAALAADIVPAPPEVHSSSLWRLVAVAGKACIAHLFGERAICRREVESESRAKLLDEKIYELHFDVFLIRGESEENQTWSPDPRG
jgi:hypothetical protein